MNTNIYKIWVGSSDGMRSAEFIARAEAPSLAFLSVAKHLGDRAFYGIPSYEGMPFAFRAMADEERTFYSNPQKLAIKDVFPLMVTYTTDQSARGVKLAQHQIPPAEAA